MSLVLADLLSQTPAFSSPSFYFVVVAAAAVVLVVLAALSSPLFQIDKTSSLLCFSYFFQSLWEKEKWGSQSDTNNAKFLTSTSDFLLK